MSETDQPDNHEAEVLAAYAAEFLDQMPADRRAECELLADLEPQSAGVRVHRAPGGWHLTWVNVYLGTVLDEALVERLR